MYSPIPEIEEAILVADSGEDQPLLTKTFPSTNGADKEGSAKEPAAPPSTGGGAAPVGADAIPTGTFCPSCGGRVDPNWRFCSHCGGELQPASAAGDEG